MLAAAAAMTSAPACQGVDMAITAITSTSTQSTDVTRFTLTVTVANLGTKNEPGNTLQSVEIVLDDNKNGQKGVPPLRAGQKYTFTYDVLRANDTEPGSTIVKFHIVQQSAVQDCNPANDSYRIAV